MPLPEYQGDSGSEEAEPLLLVPGADAEGSSVSTAAGTSSGGGAAGTATIFGPGRPSRYGILAEEPYGAGAGAGSCASGDFPGDAVAGGFAGGGYLNPDMFNPLLGYNLQPPQQGPFYVVQAPAGLDSVAPPPAVTPAVPVSSLFSEMPGGAAQQPGFILMAQPPPPPPVVQASGRISVCCVAEEVLQWQAIREVMAQKFRSVDRLGHCCNYLVRCAYGIE